MKIKCPWYIHYNETEVFTKIQDLADHLEIHESRFVARELAEKIFNIHEKIEDLDEARKQIGKPLTSKDADAAATQEWGIQLLNSLLENNKK
jgi:hypothetical protein